MYRPVQPTVDINAQMLFTVIVPIQKNSLDITNILVVFPQIR